MPLEVKELHIKISVNDKDRNQVAKPNSTAKQQEAIVQICVDRILDILKRKMER